MNAKDWSHIFIFSMGRSGGTLLKKVINCDPRFEIHGENHGVLRNIMEIDRVMEQTRSISYPGREKPFTSTNTAWHGYTKYSAYRVLSSVLAFRDDVISGFKEVRHGGGSFDELCSELDFLLKVCPRALLVLNTRDVAEVVRSQILNWDGGNQEQAAYREEVAMRQYENFLRYRERVPEQTYVIDYRDIVDISDHFALFLSDIVYAHNIDFVRRILQFKIG